MRLLEAEGLRYRHAADAPEAVAGASLAVAGGEVVGLIGPNAAGKSTLARLCCGLLTARRGSVSLRGTPVDGLSRRERARRVAFLPQHPPHDLSFTARLSGGERQRVFLARAFAQEASLLVLDEPTAALDLAHQVLLVSALRRRAREGGGALLVLHDLALAGAACDRLVLLDRGRVVAEGPPAVVLRPAVLSPVYGTEVEVVANPATGQPLVAPRIPR